MPLKDARHVSLYLAKKEDMILNKICEKESLTYSEVCRNALRCYDIIRDIYDSGDQLFVVDKKNTIKHRIVIL